MTQEEEIQLPTENDIQLVVKYVRMHLYPKVKFLYDKTDLHIGGRIYRDYVEKASKEQSCRRIENGDVDLTFLALLWNAACEQKLQKKTLNLKRSGVYTVMQNKFAGK